VAELESRFHPSKEMAASGATSQQSSGDLNQFLRDVEKFGFRLTWKDLAKVPTVELNFHGKGTDNASK
jgi:hypothetical protein